MTFISKILNCIFMNYITFPLTKKRLFYFCKLCVLTLSGRMSRKNLCCDWHQFARFRTVMTHYYVLTYHFKKVGVKQEKEVGKKIDILVYTFGFANKWCWVLSELDQFVE